MVSVVGRAVCGRRCRFGSRICRFDCPGRGAFIRNVPKRLFGSGCLAFCSHGCSLLLTMCKNRHVPRICKINSTNSAFFITNTRRAALRRTGFSSLRMSFRSREMAARPSFACGRCLIKDLRNRREAAGVKAAGPSGFVIGGLVYPLEVVYVQSVVFTPAEKCTIAIRGTRYHDVVGF